MNKVIFPRTVQAPAAVVMIRPHFYTSNPETLQDNAFQTLTNNESDNVASLAFEEVTVCRDKLEEHGIKVHLFEDKTKETPDSVFPNNWFSTHSGGHVAIYPMYPVNRRKERRQDIIEMLKREYRVQDVVDYSGLEMDNIFLEGTGAMVLDHLDRVAYAVNSNRTNSLALERFCSHFNYEPMVFDACNQDGVSVYHTNVMMSIGSEYSLIGLCMIKDKARREEIVQRLEQSGKAVIPLSFEQIANFAGNALELQGEQGRILALSARAAACLTQQQKNLIEQSAKLLPLEIPTIENSGGSVRCMLAGIHLAARF